jgi:hypothetical protein
VVHVRTLDGKPLRFGHSGWLWHNAYLLYDEGTGSLWHHFTGVAMAGPLRGRALRGLPTAQMTWGAWKREHPRTRVLRKPDADPPDWPMERDVYAARNARLDFGFALDVAGRSRLHRWESFPPDGRIEDEFEGVPYVVVRDAEARSAAAWDRRVDGVTLSFERDTASDGRPVLRERGGRRAWSLRSGAPEPGTGAAASLTRLAGSVWEDSAWSLQHPGDAPWRPGTSGPR